MPALAVGVEDFEGEHLGDAAPLGKPADED
jgi:hypothetical protein